MTGTTSSPAWYPDPTGRFELRFWDGIRWTEHVARSGESAVDPIPQMSALSTNVPYPQLVSAKRHRWRRRVLVIVLAVVATSIAAVAIVAVANRTVFTDRLLAADFRKGEGPFVTRETPDYSLQVVDGTYRIQSRTADATPEKSFASFARTAFVVNITADVASVSADSSLGVGCLLEPGRGYIFVAMTSGGVALARQDSSSDSSSRPIAEDAAVPVPAGNMTLRLTCRDNVDNSISLTGYLNGQKVITGRDDHGFDGFSAGVVVFANPAAGSEVRFNSVYATVSEPAPRK